MFKISSRRRRLTPVLAACGSLLAAASLAATAAPAQAALITTGACDSSTLTQPFAAWGDSNYYKLVPGGDFEGALSGWTLSGGAAQVLGSEPSGVTGSVGAKSLSLPAGASVASPLTCVDAGYPGLRFMARNDGLASLLAVSLSYKAPLLGLISVPVGTVALSGDWHPTARMLTLSLIPGLLTGGTTDVSVHFTELTGTTQIDDVFVDPRMTR